MLKRQEKADAPPLPEVETAKDFLKKRDKWIDHVNQCADVSHAAARVGTFIALRMNAKNRRSNWPVKKIARMVNCSVPTVSEAINQLVGVHLLVVSRPNRRANQSYSIRLPVDVEIK